MRRRQAFRQLILARVREFYREPEAIFWVYGFPLLLAVGLGLAFSGGSGEVPLVDVRSDGEVSAGPAVAALRKAKLQVEEHPEAAARTRFRKGRTASILIPETDGYVLVYDPNRSESELARRWAENALLRADGATLRIEERTVEEPGSRFIDFLLPGLIGINLMGGGLFGVGFVLVDMRVRKLFKRLMATPVHRGDFLLALLGSRLLFLMPEMLALLLVGGLAFGVPLRGSPLDLLVVILLGAGAFAGIGLLLGSRTEKTETISGLINLVMLPMYLLSGVFFSSQRFPEVMQPFIQALPLTQLNDALREVMLEGAGLSEIPGRLAILAAWGGGSFFAALRLFSWR